MFSPTPIKIKKVKMNKNNNNNKEQSEPTFKQLMTKFQFHNDAVQYHAHIAQKIGDVIRDQYPEEAKETGYFTDDFFQVEKQTE